MYITKSEVKNLLEQGYVFRIKAGYNRAVEPIDCMYRDSMVQAKPCFASSFERTIVILDRISQIISRSDNGKGKKVEILKLDI